MMVTFLDSVLFVTYFFLLFLSIFWIIVLFSSNDRTEPGKKQKRQAYFTTIIPVYNEETTIQGTLYSVLNLEYPSEKMEVIVVNDGSTDRTAEIVENVIKEYPNKNITLVTQKNHGKGRAMNEGLKLAKGEFFACLDADSFISSNALEVMLPFFEEEDVAAVCPLMKVKKPGSILQKVQWHEYTINMFYRHLNAKINTVHVTPGPFSVYRTEIIKKLGGFDETTITEDLELAIRLQKHHYRICQTFDTIVETVAPNSWRQLFRQRVRWYKGSCDNTIKYRELMFNKKYGDFGMVRMPTVVASGVIAIILTTALLQSLFQRLYQSFISLKAVNFDIFTLIKNYSFNFNLLNLPFFKIAIAGTLLSISFFVMFYSFKLVREKISRHGRTWLSLVTYLLIYSFFLTTVWFYIAYMFIRKKRNFWF